MKDCYSEHPNMFNPDSPVVNKCHIYLSSLCVCIVHVMYIVHIKYIRTLTYFLNHLKLHYHTSCLTSFCVCLPSTSSFSTAPVSVPQQFNLDNGNIIPVHFQISSALVMNDLLQLFCHFVLFQITNCS